MFISNYCVTVCGFVLLCTAVIEASRILVVVPTPSISHQVVFRPITQELAKRGHEVVVITTDPAFPKGQAPANLTEIDVHDESYEEWEKGFMGIPAKGRTSDVLIQYPIFFKMFVKMLDLQLKHKEVQTLLNETSKKFDLLILEACARPALVFSHAFKVPVILVSSLGRFYRNYEAVGAPTHPLLYPMLQRTKLNDLTFWDKLSELYNYYAITYYYWVNEYSENQMAREHFGPNIPTMSDLANNVDMLFLNMHPIWEGNVPVPPGVIHMWGVHRNPEKELPKGLKSYLDASKHGVIYMSFGTNVHPSMLPPERIQIFIKVFSQLPYDVLWKWDKDELPGISKNVKISKWFPQSDMLRHPKIKLFITQGGLQSTDEAISAGIPLIGIPMLGDQWFNVERYITHNIGERIDLNDITEDKLKNTVTKIIGDESYRENIIKLRTLMNDQPQSALERAVWWTEYVLRHSGTRHLRSPAANMSWSEYLELELVFTLLAGLFITLLVFVVVIYSFIRYLNRYFMARIKIKST